MVSIHFLLIEVFLGFVQLVSFWIGKEKRRDVFMCVYGVNQEKLATALVSVGVACLAFLA